MIEAPETPSEHERVVALPDEPIHRPTAPRSPCNRALAERPPHAPGAWLLPVVALAAIVAGALLVMRGPDLAFATAFGALVGAGLLWVLVSSLFPNKPDRGCPACGATALVRLSRASTRGLRCRRCDWTDESASSFFLAEEEGPIEAIVLAERRDSNPAP